MSDNNDHKGEEYPFEEPRQSSFGRTKVDFPVTYDLKVFMDATVPDKINKNNLARVLYELEVPFSHWNKRLSSEGKYISFSVSITVNNKTIFTRLYKELKELPGVKYAI
jgi:putative lipoic acid-binding regulatory protein